MYAKKKFNLKNFFNFGLSIQNFYFAKNQKILLRNGENMKNEKISIKKSISEEAQKESINQKKEFAFFLQTQIKKLNGHYLKSEKNMQFRIYTPKNVSATIHFLDDESTKVNQPHEQYPQQKQKMYMGYLRPIEKDLIKANIGYMPYLQY